MKVDLLKQLNHYWHVVAQTPCSQKFVVDIRYRPNKARALVDIHYVKPYGVYVTISLIGEKRRFNDIVRSELFADLKEIIYRRSGKYQVIAYTLTFSSKMFYNEIPI